MNDNNIIRSFTPTSFQVRETPQGRTISGYAIVFNEASVMLFSDDGYEEREVIDPAAVTKDFLDQQDIKMTMFHDRHLILARSNHGKGTLSYTVDAHGVKFSFTAPKTADGDKAVELVKRGDIAGCSFMFSCPYESPEYVKRTTKKAGGVTVCTCRVVKMDAIYDFTLAADPAYPSTSVSARQRQTPGMSSRKAAAVARLRRMAKRGNDGSPLTKQEAIARCRRAAAEAKATARMIKEWM